MHLISSPLQGFPGLGSTVLRRLGYVLHPIVIANKRKCKENHSTLTFEIEISATIRAGILETSPGRTTS